MATRKTAAKGASREAVKRSRGDSKPSDAKPSDKSTEAKIAAAKLRRRQRGAGPEATPETPSVSAGAVDRVIDLAFNPSREKIREVTIIDRVQGRLFPILDMIIAGRNYILEIALFRQDAKEYQRLFKRDRPVSPNLLDEFMFRTAQWQKSVQGKNLERATDIALAETEIRGGEEGETASGADAWRED